MFVSCVSLPETGPDILHHFFGTTEIRDANFEGQKALRIAVGRKTLQGHWGAATRELTLHEPQREFRTNFQWKQIVCFLCLGHIWECARNGWTQSERMDLGCLVGKILAREPLTMVQFFSSNFYTYFDAERPLVVSFGLFRPESIEIYKPVAYLRTSTTSLSIACNNSIISLHYLIGNFFVSSWILADKGTQTPPLQLLALQSPCSALGSDSLDSTVSSDGLWQWMLQLLDPKAEIFQNEHVIHKIRLNEFLKWWIPNTSTKYVWFFFSLPRPSQDSNFLKRKAPCSQVQSHQLIFTKHPWKDPGLAFLQRIWRNCMYYYTKCQLCTIKFG